MTGVVTSSPPRPRERGPARLPALGALGAQVAQALGNFTVQVLAARELGATGIGMFAFMFGALVMATALSSGLVGDSLTVLDRHDPGVRRALWRVAWLVVAGSSLVALVIGTATLSWSVGLLFATAMATYVLADLGRRLLMARLRFWSLAGVDVAALVVAVGVLGAGALVGELRLEHFLAALTASQLTTVLLALRRLPADERGRPRRAPGARGPRGGWADWGDWRSVVGYGGWRAVQQFVRPTMLNGARWLVLVAAGTSVVGELEVARLVVAPAMLLVQGLASYLFASYAADRHLGTALLRRRADRAAATMLAGSVVVGAAAALALPLVEDLLGDGAFELSAVAVLGWACYAASCAAVMPYGSLAAVRGRQLAVLVVRLVDSVVALLLVAVVLLLLHGDPVAMPWLLSTGAFVGGLLCRQVLLTRDAIEPHNGP